MTYTATRETWMLKAEDVHSRLKDKRLYSVVVTVYRRPRSTGPNSQNSRLYGHCSDLAEQLVDSLTGRPSYTTDEVKSAMMRMAVAEGYPTHLSVDGAEVPLPTRHSSVKQLSVILEVIQRFADEHNFYLTEVDKATRRPYRSIGGRTLKEMEVWDEGNKSA